MADCIKSSKNRTSPQIQSLQSDTQCWYKVKVFLFDLRHFKERTDSRDRLEPITDPSYIGAPYFEPAEIQRLKSLVADDREATLEQIIESTLDEKMDRRMKKRVASNDYRVCAAHDLAPVFEKAFNVKPKELQRGKKFIKALTADGLLLKQK